MQFIDATLEYFPEIINLVSSPEELFLVYPKGHYPWDVEQLTQLYQTRKSFTAILIDGSIAAFANLYDVKPGESAFIGNIIVSDRFKGQGIGKALTKQMIQICEQTYQATAHLSVFNFNTKALLLYSSLGFVPYALEPRENLNGETVALIHMQKTQKMNPSKTS